MAKVRLGGADQQFLVVGEHLFHCQRFDAVIRFSAGTVGVDVLNLLRGNARIFHRLMHHLYGTAGARIRSGFVERIAGGGVGEYFTVNGGAARDGVLVLFQHHGARAFTNRHAGVAGKRRTGFRMHDVQGIKTGEGWQVDRLCPDGQHRFAFAVLDIVKRHADRVRAGRTGGRNQFNPALQSEQRRDAGAAGRETAGEQRFTQGEIFHALFKQR